MDDCETENGQGRWLRIIGSKNGPFQTQENHLLTLIYWRGEGTLGSLRPTTSRLSNPLKITILQVRVAIPITED